jgi:hypothetical protein
LAFAALDAARKVGLAGGFAAAHRDIDNDLKTCYKARTQRAFFLSNVLRTFGYP